MEFPEEGPPCPQESGGVGWRAQRRVGSRPTGQCGAWQARMRPTEAGSAMRSRRWGEVSAWGPLFCVLPFPATQGKCVLGSARQPLAVKRHRCASPWLPPCRRPLRPVDSRPVCTVPSLALEDAMDSMARAPCSRVGPDGPLPVSHASAWRFVPFVCRCLMQYRLEGRGTPRRGVYRRPPFSRLTQQASPHAWPSSPS